MRSSNSLTQRFGMHLAARQADETYSFRIWYCHYCTAPLARPGEPATDRGEREGAKMMHDGRAFYLGPVSASVDHILAQSEGGSDDPENLVLCCRQCNSSKGNRPAWAYESWIKEWMWRNRHFMLWMHAMWDQFYAQPSLEETCYDEETRSVDMEMLAMLQAKRQGR